MTDLKFWDTSGHLPDGIHELIAKHVDENVGEALKHYIQDEGFYPFIHLNFRKNKVEVTIDFDIDRQFNLKEGKKHGLSRTYDMLELLSSCFEPDDGREYNLERLTILEDAIEKLRKRIQKFPPSREGMKLNSGPR